MRLTHIKLAGFKSFVDPTTLSLASNLTGVVGPNGCGKSNVIDAVRWVTGESNARHLRGEALEDVIFNGSNARKPVGRASVELRFDNSQGKLGGEWASYAEINVRRELTRDGASKYTINNTRARRRDVVDLFLGTGLGGRSNYAVIEQGAVNRLIEARPEDMRQVLEEAAGISKYKERRRETENRMRHTRENLDRLNDLIGELTERLATLKRQADNAEKYKTLKARERQLRTELLALKWQDEARAVEAAQSHLGQVEQELRAATTTRRDALAAREQVGHDQHAAGEAVQASQAVYYDAQASVGRIEQALAHARTLAERLDKERQSLVDRLDRAARSRDADEAQLVALDREIARDQDRLKQAGHEHETARHSRHAAEQAADEAERVWDGLSQQTTNPIQQLEAERTRARYAEAELEKLTTRRDKRVQEYRDLDTAADVDLDAQREALSARKDTQASEAAEQEAAQAQERRHIAAAAEAEQALADARREIADAEAECAAARRMQQALLREDDTALQAWFDAQGLGAPAGLARRIRFEAGYESLAKAALGDWLAAFEIAMPADTAHAQAWPGERLTLAAGTAEPAGDDILAPADGLVPLARGIAGPAVVMRAAADIFVAGDIETARAALPQLAAHQRIVTKAGVLLGPGWLTTPPPADDTDAPSAYAREQRIAALDAAIADAGERRDEAAQRAEKEREQAGQATRARQTLEQRLGSRRREIETAEAELEGDTLRVAETRRRAAELETEITELDEQLTTLKTTRAQTQTQIDHLREAAERFEAERSQARATLAETRRVRDQARHTAGEKRRRVDQLEAQRAQYATQREALVTRIAENRETVAALTDEIAAFDAAAPAADSESYTANDLTAAKNEREQAETALRQARETAKAQEQRLEAARDDEMRAEQALETVRERQNEARLALEAATTRRSGVVEQLREIGAAPAPIVDHLPGAAVPAEWQAAIETVEKQIARLGAINLAAIDEYEEAGERERYLAAQHQDLVEALETLEAAIARIDRETRQRFKHTYEQINDRFSAMFPELFSGGEAALTLTEQDWLTTGVRVMARPPGKRNASIQMLSGGEKTLTAVALLFALFELNPAPFCMLDEIDAPLDDANVARFCDLVRTMSDKVQFIVITHNKLTMELTEQLHGVTMAEPGVSRLVSVDIDTALGMAG